jgi:ABC-type transport system involved in multi-copper enzyme maturation permease subunit
LLPLGRESSSKSSDASKKKKFPYVLINPDKTRSPFGVGSLIFVKELRCKMFGHMGNLLRGIYFGLMVSIGLVILVSLNVDTLSLEAVKVVSVLFQMVIILLMTPALTASAVSEEVQSGTLEMLRMTPVSAWKFWQGKVKAGNFYMLILIGASCPIYGMLALLDMVMGGDMMVVFKILGLQAMFLLLTSTCGVWCSAWTEQTQKAIGLSYAVLFSLVILPFCAPSLLGAPWGEWFACLSPFYIAISQVSEIFPMNEEYFIVHLIISFLFCLLMLIHSLFMVHSKMRQVH